MWETLMLFIQARGVDRVIMLSLIGLALLAITVAYWFKPEKYLLHIIYVFSGLVVLYPAYNYAIDYIEMSQSIVHADPAIREELMAEIDVLMQWHIWFPLLFIVPAILLVLTTRILRAPGDKDAPGG